MKKTAKSLLAIILALVMALGTIPAFAADDSYITWIYNDSHNGEEHYLLGNLELGENSFEAYYVIYSAFEFNVEKEGYYAITGGNFWACEKVENGIAYGFADSLFKEPDYTDASTNIFYFEEGITYLEQRYPVDDVTVEYLGEEMTVDYDKSGLNELIIGCDVLPEENEFMVKSDFTATFSEKTMKLDDCFVYCTYEGTLKEGENNISVNLPGDDVDDVITAYPAEKYVKSMEISNPEKATTIYERYDGSWDYDFTTYETVTIKFADGTTKSIIDDGSRNYTVLFPNGREYWIVCDHYFDTEKSILVLGFQNDGYYNGECVVKEYACTVVEKSISDNFDDMFTDNMDNMSEAVYMTMEVLSWVGSHFAEGNISAALTILFNELPQYLFGVLRSPFDNFGMFIKSCF